MSYNFTVDWFSGNIPYWQRALDLYGINSSKPLRILEIGTFEGKSACWMSDNILDHPESKLFCVDTFQGGEDHQVEGDPYQLDTLYSRCMENLKQSKNFDKIFVVSERSDEFFAKYGSMSTNIEDDFFDLIYIDGSHLEKDVYNDGLSGFKLLKKDGLIIFDDYGWPSPEGYPIRQALDQLDNKLAWTPIHTFWQRMYVHNGSYKGEIEN